MRKLFGIILLGLFILVFFTACNNKSENETEIRVIETEEGIKNQNTDNKIGFQGGVLEESEHQDEVIEENDSENNVYEGDIIEPSKDSGTIIIQENNVIENIKEDNCAEDLMEPPAENNAEFVPLQ